MTADAIDFEAVIDKGIEAIDTISMQELALVLCGISHQDSMRVYMWLRSNAQHFEAVHLLAQLGALTYLNKRKRNALSLNSNQGEQPTDEPNR